MSLTHLKHTALVLTTLMLISFLYIKAQAIDFDKHNQMLDGIRQFKQVDAVLNQHILEIRQSILPFYDSTVENTAELTQLQLGIIEMLHQLLPQPSTDIDSHIHLHTKALQQSLIHKKELLEHFKSHNALLRNSLQFLPTITAQISYDLQQHEIQQHGQQVKQS